MQKSHRRTGTIVVLAVAAGVLGAGLKELFVSRWRYKVPSNVASEREENGRSPTRTDTSAAPPRFSPPSPLLAQRLSPGQPAYNPSPLSRIIGSQEVFDQEPRDPEWAPAVEAYLSESVQGLSGSLAAPSMKVHGVSCKTTACRVDWSSDPKDDKIARALLRLAAPGDGGFRRGAFYVFLKGGQEWYRDVGTGDIEATKAAVAAARKTVRSLALKGKRPFEALASVHPDWLPKE